MKIKKKLVLEFHACVSARKPGEPRWSFHRVKLPRAAAVELARFLYGFVAKVGDVPVQFAVENEFMEKLTEGERIHVECQEAGAELVERAEREARRVLGAEDDQVEEMLEDLDAKAVCGRCGDSHLMTLDEREVPCTFCPRPCEACRRDGIGAYCGTTPCSCACHAPRGT